MKPKVSIFSTDRQEVDRLTAIVENHVTPYRTQACDSLQALKDDMACQSCMAAILDLDTVALDNRTIRDLTLRFPAVAFLCASSDRFHPELKEAICYHLFACLTKPIDPEELHYFLKCIHEAFLKETR